MKNIFKSDYVLNVTNKIVSVLLGIVSTMFLTRYLRIELKGEYSYITQISSICVIVLDFGITQTYSYYYRKNKGGIYNSFVDLYATLFVVYIVFAVIIGAVTRFANMELLLVMSLIPFAVSHKQMEATMAVENIRFKIKVHMVNAVLKVVLFALIFFVGFFTKHNLYFPVFVTILIDALTLVVYCTKNRVVPVPFRVKASFIAGILRYSFIPMLTALLITLNYSVDIVFLKKMDLGYDLSIYSTAAGVINYIWLIPDAFKEVLVSRVSKSDDPKHVNFALKISVAFLIFVILGFALLGKLALKILYGSEFVASYGIVLILIIGCVSMTFYKIIGVLMLAEGKRMFYFITLLVSVITNVVLNAVFIPRYGMYGAAWASVGSYTVCGMAFLAYYLILKKQSLKDALLITPSEIKEFLKGTKRKGKVK